MTGESVRPLSILWLNQLDPAHPWAGGAERHIAEVSRRLLSRGHRVTLVAEQHAPLAREEQVQGVHVLRAARRGLLHMWAVANARRLVQRFQVDVVIGDLSKIVPWGRQSFGGRPLVSIVRHISGRTIFGEAPFPTSPMLWLVERATPLFLAHADVVTEARATADVLERLGMRGEHVQRIPPGVDVSTFSPMPHRRASTPLVVYAGRLKRYKRLDLALAAFRLLKAQRPEARFEIAGTGDDAPRLEREVDRLGLRNSVEFRGALPTEGLVDLYRRGWVHVQPSAVEGWGCTTLEAMACGTPVAAFSVAALPEALGPVGAEFLARNADVGALASAIHRACARVEAADPAFAESLVAQARGYSWDATFEGYERLLSSAAGRWDARIARGAPDAWSPGTARGSPRRSDDAEAA